jgi:hypothetical protein
MSKQSGVGHLKAFQSVEPQILSAVERLYELNPLAKQKNWMSAVRTPDGFSFKSAVKTCYTTIFDIDTFKQLQLEFPELYIGIQIAKGEAHAPMSLGPYPWLYIGIRA